MKLTPVRRDQTSYSGELSEAETTRLLKEHLCGKVGIDPDDTAVEFKALMASDAGGIGPIRRYISWSLTIDHTKQPGAKLA